MVKYYCDDCGKELILPWREDTQVNVDTKTYMMYVNTDGYKWYDNGVYLDLCNKCKTKRSLALYEQRENHTGP